MHDDDPDDVVHDLFAEAAVRRPPARPAGHRHRRVDRGADPRADRAATTAAATAPRTWSSRPPATSTTPPSYAWCARRSARPASWPRRGPARAGPPRRGRAPHVARRPRSPSQPADRAGQPRARRARAGPRPTSGGSPSACSTRRSAAACPRRLFQEVREKRGLAYSVYSFASHYADTGHVRRLRRLRARQGRRGAGDLPRRARARSPPDGITAEELERGKGQLRGALVLGLEDTGSRMSRLGKAELVYGELLGSTRCSRRIDAVTARRRARGGRRAARPAARRWRSIGPFDDADRAYPRAAGDGRRR